MERFNQRLREFEEDQRAYRNHHVAAAVERQSQSEHNADLVDVSFLFFFSISDGNITKEIR